MADRSTHRGGQPQEALWVLQHVVVEPALERLDRDLLAERPGAEDHRALRPALLERLEQQQPVGEAERVVGDDQIVGPGLERGGQGGRVARLAHVERGELAREGPPHEQAVVRVVVDEQEPQRVAHGRSSRAPLAPGRVK